MTDHSKDFTHHMKMAGDAHAAGNAKQAAHHLGHALRSQQKQNPAAVKAGIVTNEPAPMGDETPDPSLLRGFGPGRQFGKGSGTGTPRPKMVDGQKPSLRGRLAGIARRGK